MEKKGRVAAYTKEPNMQTCYLNMYEYANILFMFIHGLLKSRAAKVDFWQARIERTEKHLFFYQNQLQELHIMSIPVVHNYAGLILQAVKLASSWH